MELIDGQLAAPTDENGNFILSQDDIRTLTRRVSELFRRRMCDDLDARDVVIVAKRDWDLIAKGQYRDEYVDTLNMTRP